MQINKGIKETEIEGEKVYLKKGWFGWRIVAPLKVDGKFNWFNFLTGGSWGKLIGVILTVLAILFIAWAYNHDVSLCKELIQCGASCPESFNINIPNLSLKLP